VKINPLFWNIDPWKQFAGERKGNQAGLHHAIKGLPASCSTNWLVENLSPAGGKFWRRPGSSGAFNYRSKRQGRRITKTITGQRNNHASCKLQPTSAYFCI